MTTIENLKRVIVLMFAALAVMTGPNHVGFRFNSFAAWRGNQDEVQNSHITGKDDCSYLQNPDRFHQAVARHREELSNATTAFAATLNDDGLSLVPPQDVPRKNFIDQILFDRMAKDNVMSAPLVTDEEFIRRAHLDITGRIPSAEEVTSFLKDAGANKRDALIDKLIGSPDYVDKWTMFFGDLFKNNDRATNVRRFTNARDAFYNYIKDFVSKNKSYAQVATELITANGDNFVLGEANFIVGGIVPMGPDQDTMDGTAVEVSRAFLGINALDCLLCHDGAGHLDTVNLWGSQRTRAEAWGLSAFFARTTRTRQRPSQGSNLIKFIVTEKTTGEYLLNTNYGNRSTRSPIDGKDTVEPKYIFNGGGINAGENRRQAIARHVVADKQFASAAVNFIWEKIMVEALVSPSNAFDPARLDPNAQLPTGWALQPANAELLNALADEFIQQNYDIRKLIATITKSNAYQLSSQYPGDWNLLLVPYYARKLVRRLDAEEIHDAVVKATGVSASYQLRDSTNNPTRIVNWAMQLPDTIEPSVRGANQGGTTAETAAAAQFLNSFLRGDRDVKPRSQEASIQQSLNLMNSPLVMSRIHQSNSGSIVSKLLANQSLTNEQIITQLALSTLSRNPRQDELDTLAPLFSSLGREKAAEAVQWVFLNKIDFIFNY